MRVFFLQQLVEVVVRVLYVEDMMQSRARGKESLDEKRKQIMAYNLLREFINLEDGNPHETGVTDSLEPF